MIMVPVVVNLACMRESGETEKEECNKIMARMVEAAMTISSSVKCGTLATRVIRGGIQLSQTNSMYCFRLHSFMLLLMTVASIIKIALSASSKLKEGGSGSHSH